MREGGVEGDNANVRRCWGRWQREAGGTRMQRLKGGGRAGNRGL